MNRVRCILGFDIDRSNDGGALPEPVSNLMNNSRDTRKVEHATHSVVSRAGGKR